MLSGPLLPLEDSAREGRLQRLKGVRAAGAMMLCGWQAGLIALWQLLLLCDRLILWLLLLTLRLRSGRFDVQIPLEATEGGAEREGKRRRAGEKKMLR